MAEFINTIDVLGDDAVIDSIINRTITELCDDVITVIESCVFEDSVNLTKVNFPEVTDIKWAAFMGCANLHSAEFPNVAYIQSDAFQNCTSLKEINFDSISAWNALQTHVFVGCKSLEKVRFSKLSCFSYGNVFGNCTALTTLDTAMLNEIKANVFGGCTSLKKLIMRWSGVCSLTVANVLSATPIAKGTGYIYVPKAMLSDDDETKDYRRATNWAVYAAQFRALEDYTVDGTTTGELDETKI